MKRMLLLSIFAAACSLVQAAQPLVCTQAGTQLEYAIYDGKGKITGYKVVSVDEVTRNEQGEQRVKNRVLLFDKAHEPVLTEDKSAPMEQTQYFTFRETEMVLSLNELLAGLPANSDVKMTVSGDEYTLPYDLNSGIVLPEVEIVLSLTAGDRKIDMKVKINDRQILDSEQLTTSAGVFETFKVRENTQLHFMIMNIETCSVVWYAPGIGIVREEMYSKKGKLENCTELIAIRPPARE